VTTAAKPRPDAARSRTPWRIDDADVRIFLAAAMVVSVAAGLWFSRDTTFTVDELSWYRTSPQLDVEGAIAPYNGHLILTSRLVYAGILDVFGSGYLPFRLLGMGAVLLTAGLFFVFASRRIGSLVALAPTLVLLFYGSAPEHAISGNGFTVLLALALGIGALLALEREDRRGDVTACALLGLALATYSVGIAFAAAAATLILIGADRWRRIWIFLLPTLLYGGWLLWSRTAGADLDTGNVAGTGGITLSNLLLVPDWALGGLATACSALLGLNYPFVADGESGWGPALAFVALVALGFRLQRGSVSRWLWALLAVPATLWVIEATASLERIRTPDNSRYIFPATIAILLVAVEAARGTRLGHHGIVVLYIAVVISLATNLALLREGGRQSRVTSVVSRSDLVAAELVRTSDESTQANEYAPAIREYGSPGFSLPELRAQPESSRERVDSALARSLGLGLEPTSASPRDCRRITAEGGRGTSFELPTGGAVLSTRQAPSELSLRRFGSAFTLTAGTLEPGAPSALAVPADSAPDPWYASTPASALAVCGPPG
jgi:hypothetical protein